jgi:hypothetical protein
MSAALGQTSIGAGGANIIHLQSPSTSSKPIDGRITCLPVTIMGQSTHYAQTHGPGTVHSQAPLWVVRPKTGMLGISSTALRPKHDVGSRNSNECITEEEMTTNTRRPTIDRLLNLPTIEAIASVLGRYGLVVVIGWIGA